jgi:hypothetical protein
MASETKLPSAAVGAKDLDGPLKAVLKTAKVESVAKNSNATEVIDATVLDITTRIKNLITGVGGTAVVVGAASSVWAAVKDNTPLAVTLAGGVAIVLAAMIIGLAKVMDGDVRGRAAVTTEQLTSRATIAAAFLDATATVAAKAAPESNEVGSTEKTKPTLATDLRAALAGFGSRLQIQTVHGWQHVQGIEWEDNHLSIHLSDGDYITDTEVLAFKAST